MTTENQNPQIDSQTPSEQQDATVTKNQFVDNKTQATRPTNEELWKNPELIGQSKRTPRQHPTEHDFVIRHAPGHKPA